MGRIEKGFSTQVCLRPRPGSPKAAPRPGQPEPVCVCAHSCTRTMLRFLWDSISLQMLFVFLLVFLLVSDYMKRRKPKDFPPGPFSFPFLGNMEFIIAKDPVAVTEKVRRSNPSSANSTMLKLHGPQRAFSVCAVVWPWIRR